MPWYDVTTREVCTYTLFARNKKEAMDVANTLAHDPDVAPTWKGAVIVESVEEEEKE